MKLIKVIDKEQEYLNVNAFIKLMKKCPDSLSMITVDRMIIETMIELLEKAYVK